MRKSPLAPVSVHEAVDAPSMSPSAFQLPVHLLGTVNQTDAVSTGAFPNSPPASSSPLPSWPPSPLPVPSLHLPQSPPPPPSNSLLATYPGQYPGQQLRSRGGKWWQVKLGGLRDPQASSPRGLVRLGCSSPGVPDPTSVGPKLHPTSCPALPEIGSTGPTAGPFSVRPGDSPCQCASGYKWRGTAPCTCGDHNSPEQRLLG